MAIVRKKLVQASLERITGGSAHAVDDAQSAYDCMSADEHEEIRLARRGIVDVNFLARFERLKLIEDVRAHGPFTRRASMTPLGNAVAKLVPPGADEDDDV